MDRIINISVNGYTVTKDGNVAGVKGEDNATTLVIDFSEDWDKCAKTITFWNALGYNPVGVILGTNLLTDIESSTSQYQVSIPGEALKHSGRMKFTIDGYTKEKRTRSVEVFLDVLESQEMESGPVQIVTPTQAEMLQAEIDGIKDTIQNAAKSANEAAGSAGNAATSAQNAATSAGNAATSVTAAEESAGAAATSATAAGESANEAAGSAGAAATSAQNAATSAGSASESAEAAATSAQSAEAAASEAEATLANKEDKPTVIDLFDKATTVQELLNDGHLNNYRANNKTYIVKFGKTKTNEYVDDSLYCYGILTVRKDLDTVTWSDFRVERIIQEFKFLPLDASLRYPDNEDFRPATYIRAYTRDESANFYWTEWEIDVVDSLDSFSTALPLSANQGRVLRERVAVNEIDISDNKMYINENATAIAKNSEDIELNKEKINSIKYYGVAVIPTDPSLFTFDASTGTITKYTGADTEVVIPYEIDGVRTVKIGANAFDDCRSLKSVVIPNSITSIGDYAFRYCSNLKSVNIPDGVTEIGKYAFWNCTSLKSIIIPDSVTNIRGSLFNGCTSLTSVTISNCAKGIRNGAFHGCSSLTSITIPDSVTEEIANNAFYGCKNLTTIYCSKGSYAETWAEQNGYEVIYNGVNKEYVDAKAKIETLNETSHTFEFLSTHNTEKRLPEVTSISFDIEDGEYAEDYISGLSFDSGETATSIDYTGSGILNWVGTDCTNVDGLSIFQPSTNTHYDIVFYFNGLQFIGLVNGFVPATGNVVSE